MPKELIGLFKETKSSESSLYSNCQMRYLNEVSPMLYEVTGTGHSMCVWGGGSVFVCVVCVCEREREESDGQSSVWWCWICLMPTRTASGLPVSGSPTVSCTERCLRDDCCKIAELKSLNSILTYKSFFVQMCEGWGGGQWRWVSSVERLTDIANWKGSREGWRTDLMWCMPSRSKHFMKIGVSVNGR